MMIHSDFEIMQGY